MKTLIEMQEEVREWAVSKNWRGPHAPGRSFQEDRALLHSEISEALEAYRLDALERWYVMPGSGLEDGVKIFLNKGSFNYDGFKPEGVGSEFADTFIRLLDDAAELGLQVRVKVPHKWTVSTTFGEDIDMLHNYASNLGMWQSSFDMFADALRSVCVKWDVDLFEEFEAKMAYNHTRENRHGGKLL